MTEPDEDSPARGRPRERRHEIERSDCKCSFCRPHDGDNRGKRPRDDHHKDKRKGR